MYLVDLSHTSHSAGNTGIQRVCRALHDSLRSVSDTKAVCYDPYYRGWRSLAGSEIELAKGAVNRKPGRKRGSRWTASQKLRSLAGRYGLPVGYEGLDPNTSGDIKAFFVPEIFTPRVAESYRDLFPKLKAPKIAVFHDAVVLRFPDISPTGTVSRMPVYLDELRMFDGIAANSHASKEELLDYWSKLGVKDHPIVEAVPLGTDFNSSGSNPEAWKDRRVLVVGTFEGRKNHYALLEGVEKLWAAGENFTIQFCGGVNRETGTRAVEFLQELKDKGRPIKWDGPVSDDVLEASYRECTFTIYPSLYEGFGLPVLESLSFGKPCVCTSYGALKEAAADGGCYQLNDGDSSTIAEGIKALLNDEALYRKLCGEADAKVFRTWTDYTKDMMSFAEELKK